MMLTFVHGADRKGECRRLTPEEIAKLPPNMRRVQDCPRGRRAIYVELDVDGRNVYQASLTPTGIAGDGPSRVYQRFMMPAGKYDIAVRMRDTARADGFDHEHRETVNFRPIKCSSSTTGRKTAVHLSLRGVPWACCIGKNATASASKPSITSTGNWST